MLNDPNPTAFALHERLCSSSEEELITQPERIRDDYLRNLNGFLESLRSGCIGSQVDYTLVDTSQPLDTVLTEFLQRRSSNLMGGSVGGRP